MKKIGRNDPCPCGSGLKNKKCHNIEKLPEDEREHQSAVSATESFFSGHDSHDLLNEIIGLQLVAENHGKNMRIETLADIALQTLGPGKMVDRKELKSLLDSEHSFDYNEDPPSGFFTENAVFYHGNNIVFPGIANHSNEIFRQLTQVVFNSRIVLPPAFTQGILHGVTLLLYLGNRYALQAGLVSYMKSQDDNELLSCCPHGHDYTISSEELLNICSTLGIDHRIIDDFLLTEDRKASIEQSGMDSPLLFFPIIQYSGKYYYLLPSNQLNSLNEFILRAARKFNCQELVLDAYRAESWGHFLECCRQMGWVLTDIAVNEGEMAKLTDAILQFDTNRIAYVVLDSPVSLDDYWQNPEAVSVSDKIPERIAAVMTELKSKAGLEDYEFLVMHLYDSCGRFYLGSIEKPGDREYRLAFNIHDFVNLSKGEDWESLSLWKFAKALDIFLRKTQSMAGTLELYSLYKQKSSSFYFSDERTPDFMITGTNEGAELIQHAKRQENFKALPALSKGVIGYFPVVSCADYAPIYKPYKHVGYFIEALDLYRNPIWFVSRQIRNDSMAGTLRLFTNAIGFWLYKMEPSLRMLLDPGLDFPLEVRIQLHEDIFKLLTFSEMAEHSSDDYTADYNNYILTIGIPASSLHSFSGPTNEGERRMMRHILKAFNELEGVAINDDQIDELLVSHMPLGTAKMILISDSQHDIMIDRRWLLPAFLMEDPETELLMDELPGLIAAKMSIAEKIDTGEDKRALFNTATSVLLEKLAEEAGKFDNALLLTLLLNLHESIVQKRDYDHTITPAQLICFGDLESKVDKIHTEQGKVTRTSVSLRNLVEYLAAVPSKGTQRAGLDDVDRLLAIMHEVTNYGMMSDAVHFKMDDPEVGLLPSGRIGFTSQLFSEKIAPYGIANTRAEIDRKIDNFADKFEIYVPPSGEPSEEVLETVARHDKAFLADWGISWSHMHLLFHFAVVFCIEAETSVITMPEKDFISKLLEKTQIPESEIVYGIERLSLSPRESYLKAPEGFQNNEVFPWKYNREFSLLRRFLIRHYDKSGEPLLTWGFRTASGAEHQLNSLLEGARLNNGKKEINALLGSYTKERGDRFRRIVYEWLSTQPEFIVISHEVDMSPGGTLNTDKPYGDVDVLALHEPTGVVYSIECKNTTQAKNIHEMKTEMDRYLGRDGKEGMVHKHLERHQWLTANTGQLQGLFKAEGTVKVKSLMVSSQVIPTPYIRAGALPMPILAFPELKRDVKLLFQDGI